MTTSTTSLRSLAGVLLFDLRRYLSALAGSGEDYLGIRNRTERLEAAPEGKGYRCLWQWTSELHAPKVLPSLGSKLMARALREHPVELSESPGQSAAESSAPVVSFIIGHRGMERVPHLLATLSSIAAQAGVGVECVVVEQDVEARLTGLLPKWVKHLHTPPPSAAMKYCRSWTFNVGAKACAGRILVLHDNDMMVPVDYARSIADLVDRGYEVVNLKRFIFYLSERETAAFFAGSRGLDGVAPESVIQNLEAGGSIAITREAFDAIGGMDESFIGWGGEDNEFWERAQLRRVWPYANLPIVHLWHPSQPGKEDKASQAIQQYAKLAEHSPEARMARLRSVARGQMHGPAGYLE